MSMPQLLHCCLIYCMLKSLGTIYLSKTSHVSNTHSILSDLLMTRDEFINNSASFPETYIGGSQISSVEVRFAVQSADFGSMRVLIGGLMSSLVVTSEAAEVQSP